MIAAKHLVGMAGISVAEDLAEVEYWHFLFDAHQVVFSNGACTESLFTGPEALKSVSSEAREEIFAILPQLRSLDHDLLPAARILVRGRRARQLVHRLSQNDKSLVA